MCNYFSNRLRADFAPILKPHQNLSATSFEPAWISKRPLKMKIRTPKHCRHGRRQRTNTSNHFPTLCYKNVSQTYYVWKAHRWNRTMKNFIPRTFPVHVCRRPHPLAKQLLHSNAHFSHMVSTDFSRARSKANRWRDNTIDWLELFRSYSICS